MFTLISSRPRLCFADGTSRQDAVLDMPFKQAYGITELQWPAFELRALPDAQARISNWLGASDLQASKRLVVFVSPGALDLIRPCFPSDWPATLVCGLMGDGSAAKASSLGIPSSVQVYPRMALGQTQDAAGLLDCLGSAGHGFVWQHGLLIKGPAGNADLPLGLLGLCADLQVLQAYERQPLAVDTRQTDLLSGAIVFYLSSSEAAHSVCPVILACQQKSPPQAVTVLTTHPKIADAARLAGLSPSQPIDPGPAALRAWVLQHFAPTQH